MHYAQACAIRQLQREVIVPLGIIFLFYYAACSKKFYCYFTEKNLILLAPASSFVFLRYLAKKFQQKLLLYIYIYIILYFKNQQKYL